MIERNPATAEFLARAAELFGGFASTHAGTSATWSTRNAAESTTRACLPSAPSPFIAR